MFVFANIKFLYLLIIIPLMIVLYIIVQARQRKCLIKFGNIEMLKGIILCAGITLVPNSFRNLIYKIIRK